MPLAPRDTRLRNTELLLVEGLDASYLLIAQAEHFQKYDAILQNDHQIKSNQNLYLYTMTFKA